MRKEKIEDYRNYIKSKQEALKRSFGSGFHLQDLAEHCRIQQTYLSRVLHLKAHFNDDQLFLASQFLKLDEDEYVYLKLLHEYTRTSLKERQRILKGKIAKLQGKNLSADKSLTIKKIDPSQQDYNLYFLMPYAQIIHAFLALDEFRNDTKKIAKVLSVKESVVAKTLNLLHDIKLLKINNGVLELQDPSFFLPADHPLSGAYHSLAKQLALSKIQGLPQEDKSCFSMVVTCREATWKKLRKKIQALIAEIQHEAVKDSTVEGVYQISLDFFPWYRP